MHNYSLAKATLIDEIGRKVYGEEYWEKGDTREGRKFAPIKNSPVPFIPCQYHGIDERLRSPASGRFYAGNMYPDKSWESARVTGSGARRRLEYYGGFNVVKDDLGRCLIPDTPNNRLRLKNMAGGKKQIFETEMFVDERGVHRSRRVMRYVPAPARYTMIEEENAVGNLDALIEAAAERLLEKRAVMAELPGAQIVSAPAARMVAPAGIVDLREPEVATDAEDNDNGQPDAPAPGGDDEAPPPVESSPAPRRGRPKATPVVAAPVAPVAPAVVPVEPALGPEDWDDEA